jgi:polysaccharide export outer membrane protein
MFLSNRFQACLVFTSVLICGCAQLPGTGPSADEILQSGNQGGSNTASIQIVDVDEAITRQLLAQRTQRLFSETLGNDPGEPLQVGAGDVLEVSIWEAVPATLFGSGGQPDVRGITNTSRATTLPEQVVSRAGNISIPFVGAIKSSNRSLQQIEVEIADRLKGKANQPQVLVRVVRNASSNVTVVGEVSNSTRMPLTPRGERLLDALAAAGGVRQPVNKTTIQVTRGSSVQALPLEAVIRDPRQNIPLQPGDVITALFQPLSFTALGATGKNEEINFEAQGITLAQALARSGGLVDSRSSPLGVFIFRFESQSALKWPKLPAGTTPEGQVPVVYRMDLKDPRSFFVMQSFPIQNRDILYVSNAPMAELQKFLNVVFSVTYPVLSAIQVTK